MTVGMDTGRPRMTAALRRSLDLAPVAAALAYPFLLKGFHAAVSPTAGGVSIGRAVLGGLCLAAAVAVPLIGLAGAQRLRGAIGTRRNLYARRAAFFSMTAPPLFVLAGVGLGLLHSPVKDLAAWVMIWLAVAAAVFFATDSDMPAAARPAASWRVAHGVGALVVLTFILFHLGNHLMGLVGPELHGQVMKAGRLVYRSRLVEPVLVAFLLFQLVGGLRLAWRWSATPLDGYRVFQVGSGVYLAGFLLAHMNSALISARLRHLETDWRWASGAPDGLLLDGWNIRLLPHYGFGVFFVLAHLCSGLRVVAITHGMNARMANQCWVGGLVASGLIAAAILGGLCGVRL